MNGQNEMKNMPTNIIFAEKKLLKIRPISLHAAEVRTKYIGQKSFYVFPKDLWLFAQIFALWSSALQ